MSGTNYQKGLLLAFIIILPTLFFALSSDHIIYLLGGKTIAAGGRLYIDFIDIKPPPIYLIFSVLYSIGGMNEIVYRIFDVIWQLLTVYSLAWITFRITNNSKLSSVISVIYALLYTTLNFSHTLQCETIASLPLIWAMYFQIRHKKRHYYLIIGLLLGITAGLKYTLGISLIVFLLDEFLIKNENNKNKAFLNSLLTGLGFIISFFLPWLLLFDSQIFSGFTDVLIYLKDYARPVINSQTISLTLKQTAVFFADNFSLTLSLLSITSFIWFIRKRKMPGKTQHFFLLTILLVVFFIFTVFLENKFVPYHFSRMYAPLSVLSGFGFIYFLKVFFAKSTKRFPLKKTILILLAVFGLIFSPLPRWLILLKPTFHYFNNKVEYDKYYSREGNVQLTRVKQRQVGDIIRKESNPNDKITVMANGSNQIYLFSGLKNFSKFGQSQFYFSEKIPQDWAEIITKEMTKDDWIVIQTNDRYYSITGNNYSSWEALKNKKKMYDYLNINFNLKYKFDYFLVFRRK